jgi:folylpolyglutamate synthase/dihydropteroate synthase
MVSKIKNIDGVRILDERAGKFFKKGKVERSTIQIQNMQIAISAALNTESELSIPDADSFYFPGRFEEIEKGVVIDVAHNPPAVKTLTDYIALKNEKVVVIYGAMKDKDISKCLNLLAKVSEKIFPVSIECMNRGATVADLISRSDESVKALIEHYLTDDETIKNAWLYSKEKGVTLIVTGSFYTIEKFVQWRKKC